MAEKAILKYCKWNININPPSDLMDTIYNNLTLKFNNNDKSIQIINKYKDISITLLQYAICEFNIYSQYNQIIIAFSSCYITIDKIKEDEEHNNEERCKIQNYLKDILDEIIKNINLDKNLIESCSSLILLFIEKDSEDNEENEKNENFKEKDINLDINYQLEMSRSDSNLSNLSFIDVINNYNDDKQLDDLISESSINDDDTNNTAVKYNFEKMSPINKSEIITINEEFKDNFEFSYCKNVNKIFFLEKSNKNLNNLKFLNNKRNEDTFNDINY